MVQVNIGILPFVDGKIEIMFIQWEQKYYCYNMLQQATLTNVEEQSFKANAATQVSV